MITSRSNPLLQQARAVRDGHDKDLIFVEGLRLAEEAISSQLAINAVIVSEELAKKPKASAVLKALQEVSKRYSQVSEKLLESISFTKTPQGIVLLAGRPANAQKHLTKTSDDNSLLVVMHAINNPVNVGAVLRTAEAAGVTGVIATRNTSDPFSPKSLRGAMGSAFRLPIWTGANFQEVIDWCRAKQIRSICADAAATSAHTEIDWTGGCALIIGPESTGLTDEEIGMATTSVKIPMLGEVESLNVSVATGILLYEAFRQRQMKITPPSRKTR